MTSSGIEHATFRLVAQCLNQTFSIFSKNCPFRSPTRIISTNCRFNMKDHHERERKYCGFMFLRLIRNISLGFVCKDAEYRTLDFWAESNIGDFTKIGLICWQLRRWFRWRTNRNDQWIALKKLGQIDELQQPHFWGGINSISLRTSTWG